MQARDGLSAADYEHLDPPPAGGVSIDQWYRQQVKEKSAAINQRSPAALEWLQALNVRRDELRQQSRSAPSHSQLSSPASENRQNHERQQHNDALQEVPFTVMGYGTPLREWDEQSMELSRRDLARYEGITDTHQQNDELRTRYVKLLLNCYNMEKAFIGAEPSKTYKEMLRQRQASFDAALLAGGNPQEADQREEQKPAAAEQDIMATVADILNQWQRQREF